MKNDRDEMIIKISVSIFIVMMAILVIALVNWGINKDTPDDGPDYQCVQYTDTVDNIDTSVGNGNEYVSYYTYSDVEMLAKVAYSESRGVNSPLEISCIMWTILNRLDEGSYGDTIEEVITQPNQFAYDPNNPMETDHGIDLFAIASDVLRIWNDEKNGIETLGRTLPSDYLWYGGDGEHNYFRNSFGFDGDIWDYSLYNPYTY